MAHSQYGFTYQVFDQSPLNRVIEASAPGDPWAGMAGTENAVGITYTYSSNSQDEVLEWEIDDQDLPFSIQYYSPGKLSLLVTADENGNKVKEYTNVQGQVILKKVKVETGVWMQTYYIYGPFQNLRFVLPPQVMPDALDLTHGNASAQVENVLENMTISSYNNHSYNIEESKSLTMGPGFEFTPSSGQNFVAKIEHPILSAVTLEQYAFEYRYDGRQRMVYKKVPGADPVYMVYDQWDRLVLTQDGNQRANNQWFFTKYDILNRPVLTGIYTHSDSVGQTTMQGLVEANGNRYETCDGGTSNHGYSKVAFPTTGLVYHSATYYDNYDFLNITDWDAEDNDYSFVTELGHTAEFDQVRGQVTGGKIKLFESSSTWLNQVSYCDDRYRLIQAISENADHQIDRLTSSYDFSGKMLETLMSHRGQDTVIINETFSYDHAGRLLNSWHHLHENIHWTDLVGVEVNENNDIKKTAGNGWGTGGAASTNVLPAGTDGWVQFSPSATNKTMNLGFSPSNIDAHNNTIKHGFQITSSGNLVVKDNGSNALGISFQAGDELMIERVGTSIHYRHNGAIVFTSSQSSNEDLIIDLAINSTNATMSGIRAAFGQPVLLGQNEYNELGELVDKKLHNADGGTSYLQTVDYRYNIRGWLTSINNSQLEGDDLFGMELLYDQADNPQYNGNIGQVKWNSATSPLLREYQYTYDGANRLTGADYQDSNNPASIRYDVENLTYDLNGNIKSLKRKGKQSSPGVYGGIDDLTYTYEGNRLRSVADAKAPSVGLGADFKNNASGSDEYGYDANGNMIRDDNKDITSIDYNHLNLPTQVDFGSGDYMEYLYDASGVKWEQKVYQNSVFTKTTSYLGAMVYENDSLQFVNTAEGRVVVDRDYDGAFLGHDYQYFLKDHLGNVRMTITSAKESYDFLATMEDDIPELVIYEEAMFANIAETRHTDQNFNHTPWR